MKFLFIILITVVLPTAFVVGTYLLIKSIQESIALTADEYNIHIFDNAFQSIYKQYFNSYLIDSAKDINMKPVIIDYNNTTLVKAYPIKGYTIYCTDEQHLDEFKTINDRIENNKYGVYISIERGEKFRVILYRKKSIERNMPIL